MIIYTEPGNTFVPGTARPATPSPSIPQGHARSNSQVFLSLILVVIEPYDIQDDFPDYTEIAEVVRGLKPGKSPGPSGMHAEQLKEWL